MGAGKYRNTITLQHKTKVRNGELLEETWVTATSDDGQLLENIPAEILLGPGRELLAGGVFHGQVDARINLRWFPGLSSRWRIVSHPDGTVYDIEGVSADRTRRREWRLACKAGVSNG